MATENSNLNIPSLAGLPLVGNLLDFLFRRLEFLLSTNHECSDIVAFHIWSRSYVMLNSSDFIKAVLVEHAYDFEKNVGVRIAGRELVGEGLLTSENASHKRLRKLVAPAFQHGRIVSYADIVAHYTEELEKTWNNNQVIDIAREMTHLTMRIIGKTLFDNDLLNQANELGRILTNAIRLFVAGINSPIHIPFTWPTPRNLRIQKAFKRLNTTINDIIGERRRLGVDRGDLLSMLLSARDNDGSSLSDVQIHDEVLEFLLAGHETVTNALAWTWYLLAQHPEIYMQVCDEVDHVLEGRTPTFTDLVNLPYTLQVFKESLRLYPSVYLIGRQAICSLEINGYHLPEGTVALISPYVIHRRPEYFPSPEQFNPERFTSVEERSRPRYTYIPFGIGPRNCIGNQFALMEGHLILATLIQRVIFELAAKQRVEPEPLITLRPRGGIKMIIRRRRRR